MRAPGVPTPAAIYCPSRDEVRESSRDRQNHRGEWNQTSHGAGSDGQAGSFETDQQLEPPRRELYYFGHRFRDRLVLPAPRQALTEWITVSEEAEQVSCRKLVAGLRAIGGSLQGLPSGLCGRLCQAVENVEANLPEGRRRWTFTQWRCRW